MGTIDSNASECQKPGCHESAEETYTGPNDNRLRLCGKHYYKLVTAQQSELDPIGLGTADTIQHSTGVFDTQIRRESIDDLGRDREPELNIGWRMEG